MLWMLLSSNPAGFYGMAAAMAYLLQGMKSTDLMLLKRVRARDAAKERAQEGSELRAHSREALPQPIISRWSAATCLAFQPDTDFQQYLVGAAAVSSTCCKAASMGGWSGLSELAMASLGT